MKDGKDCKNPSFIFILTPKPMNINKASPPDERIKIGCHISPISNPAPPSSCKPPITFLNLSNP